MLAFYYDISLPLKKRYLLISINKHERANMKNKLITAALIKTNEISKRSQSHVSGKYVRCSTDVSFSSGKDVTVLLGAASKTSATPSPGKPGDLCISAIL